MLSRLHYNKYTKIHASMHFSVNPVFHYLKSNETNKLNNPPPPPPPKKTPPKHNTEIENRTNAKNPPNMIKNARLKRKNRCI